MSKISKLYSPTPNGNPFYEFALAADFSSEESLEATMEAFAIKLAGLNSEIEAAIAAIVSVTQVSEILHYSAMAAGLLQLKAAYQYASLKKNAPPEESVANSVISSFGMEFIDVNNHDNRHDIFDEFEDYKKKSKKSEAMEEIAKKAVELGRRMEIGFEYSGSAMRALAMISLSCHSSCKMNDRQFSRCLTEYFPTQFLVWNEQVAELFPVVGVLITEDWTKRFDNRSPERGSTVWMEKNTECRYNQIFGKKLAELLALGSMSIEDRSRLEELRTFFFGTICKMVFDVNSSNYPRVLQLVNAVQTAIGEGGKIKEGDLAAVIPAECAALADRESILTKDYVGMDGVYYRISDGLKKFAQTVLEFNLLSGHLLALTRDVLEG